MELQSSRSAVSYFCNAQTNSGRVNELAALNLFMRVGGSRFGRQYAHLHMTRHPCSSFVGIGRN